MLAMLKRSSNKGLTPWVEIVVCALVLELVAEEVELAEDAIVGSDTMKIEIDSRERIWENPRIGYFVLSHTLIDYMI